MKEFREERSTFTFMHLIDTYSKQLALHSRYTFDHAFSGTQAHDLGIATVMLCCLSFRNALQYST